MAPLPTVLDGPSSDAHTSENPLKPKFQGGSEPTRPAVGPNYADVSGIESPLPTFSILYAPSVPQMCGPEEGDGMKERTRL